MHCTHTWVCLAVAILVLSICAEAKIKIEYQNRKELEKSCTTHVHAGNQVEISYVGSLEASGQVFDHNIGGEPFRFTVGAGTVISGLEEGVKGMCVGEKRRLIIPPSEAYGEEGAGSIIPPNASLVFDIELLANFGNATVLSHSLLIEWFKNNWWIFFIITVVYFVYSRASNNKPKRRRTPKILKKQK